VYFKYLMVSFVKSRQVIAGTLNKLHVLPPLIKQQAKKIWAQNVPWSTIQEGENKLCGVMVGERLSVWEVGGSNPSQVTPKTLKMESAAFFLDTQRLKRI